MKDKIYRFVWFSLYDWEDISHYLEEMAAKGWLLDKTGSSIWRFRRVPPQKLRFEVVFFPDSSAFDPGPTEGLQTMEDYCARDGWTLLSQWAQAQIFVNDREDPVPIETDPVVQVKTLHKAMKRNPLPAYFVLLALILCQLAMRLHEMRTDPVDFFSSPVSLGMLPFWLLLLGIQGYEIFYYFRWLHRARRAAEDGVFLPPQRSRRLLWGLLALAVLLMICANIHSTLYLKSLVVWCGCYALILFLVSLARDTMKRKGTSRGINRTVSVALSFLLTFVFMVGVTVALIQGDHLREQPPETYQFNGHTFEIWHDPLPLAVEDLAPAEGVRYSTRAGEEETFLLGKREYRQDALLGEDLDAPELEYTIVEVKAAFLYGSCRAAMMAENERFERQCCPADAAPWGAQEAWEIYRHGELSGSWLLCFEGRLVELYSRNLELTPERMALIGQRLKNA